MSPPRPDEPTPPAAAPDPHATPNPVAPPGGTLPAADTSAPPSTGLRQFQARLESAAGPATTPAAAGPPAPDELPEVPGYEVLREIARGGMGRVLAARDRTLDRPVAVKVILAGWSAAADRFVRESVITGRLQHPGIPPVHALGELPDGRPFLAMKLIQGRTLAAILAARTGPAADLPHLVGVFEKVCEAVGFAHSQGVIHRDLKPQNVMVGAFGEVQVMDWGLAKEVRNAGRGTRNQDADSSSIPHSDFRTPHSAETHAGAVLGTPAYMAPEQARGEPADARADVFALGGILAAVLTGHPPFVGETAAGTVELAAAADLSGVRARLAACAADAELVAVAARCLSADATDRPADAGAVAGLVTAYRAGVEARLRRAEAERAAAVARAEEGRKRRRAQALLAAAVGVLLIGGAAVGWWRERVEGERKAAAARRAEAADALLGECERHLAADDADRAAAALAAADRSLAEAGHLGPRADRCRRELDVLRELDRTDLFLWTPVEGKAPDRTTAAGRWAAALRALGLVPGETPPAEAARVVADALIRERLLAVLDLWLAAAPSPAVRDWLRAADPDPFRDAVRDAHAAGAPQTAAALAGRADALAQPARFAVALGQLPGLRGKRAVDILAEARRRHPRSLAVVMAAGNQYPTNQKATAGDRLRCYEAAVALRPDNPGTWNCRGMALKDRGDLDEAIADYRQAIRLDPKYATARNNLGVALSAKGDTAGALAEYRAALDLDPADARVHSNLGVALARKRDPDGALASLREAVRLDPQYARGHNNLGMVLEQAGDRAAAVTHYREAIRLDPTEPRFRSNLGVALAVQGDLDGAAAELRESARLDPTFAGAPFNLGNVLRQKGDPDGAAAAFREAVRIDPNFAPGHANLGSVLIRKGDVDAAVACFEEAARLQPTNAAFRKNLEIARQLKADRDARNDRLAPPPRAVPR